MRERERERGSKSWKYVYSSYRKNKPLIYLIETLYLFHTKKSFTLPIPYSTRPRVPILRIIRQIPLFADPTPQPPLLQRTPHVPNRPQLHAHLRLLGPGAHVREEHDFWVVDQAWVDGRFVLVDVEAAAADLAFFKRPVHTHTQPSINITEYPSSTRFDRRKKKRKEKHT